jgi:hypothetical protein
VTGAAVDHLLIAVADLDAAAAAVERLGLPVAAGGRHPGWGTANRIVPLGGAYLELIARRRPIGDRLQPVRGVGGCVAAGADGMGRPPRRSRCDRRPARARSRAGRARGARRSHPEAGVERAAAEPSLPFFIEWAAGAAFPGAGGAGAGIERVELRGDPDRLEEWLGGAPLPVAVRPGRAAVERYVLHTSNGPVTIDAASLV